MEDIKMVVEYLGYEIKWEDWGRSFKITKDEESIRDGIKTLEECQKWIDSRVKQRFSKINVFCYGWHGVPSKGIATSLIPERGDTYSVWFTNEKKRRSKESIDSIYIANETNQKFLIDISSKQIQIKIIEKEIELLESQMEHLTPEMMEIKTKGGE